MPARVPTRDSASARAALQRLAESFSSCCYQRSPPDPRRQPGTHRGYELRFSALTARERDEIVELLLAGGIEPGRPFAKGPAWRIPVYGRESVELLLAVFAARAARWGDAPAVRAREWGLRTRRRS